MLSRIRGFLLEKRYGVKNPMVFTLERPKGRTVFKGVLDSRFSPNGDDDPIVEYIAKVFGAMENELIREVKG